MAEAARIAKVTFVGVQGVEGMDPLGLQKGTYVLGRSDSNDIVIKRNDISRQHARIEVAEEALTVTDLGSANGTRLNGRKLDAPARVEEGDEVEFGDRKFRCHIERVAPEPAPSAADATAIWTPAASMPSAVATAVASAPPVEVTASAERPADATAIWEPPASLKTAAPAKPGAKSKAAKGKVPKIETADVQVFDAPPATRAKAASADAGAPPRRSMVFLLFVLMLLAVAGLLGVVLYVKMQQQGGGNLDAGPTAQIDTYKAPDKLTLNELAKMSKPDKAAYRQALYFIEVKNYGNAREGLKVLADRYPGNQAVDRQRKRVDAAIRSEIETQMQRGAEGTRYLKYSEALGAYRSVVRLALPGSKERQEAEKQIQMLQAKIAEEQQKIE